METFSPETILFAQKTGRLFKNRFFIGLLCLILFFIFFQDSILIRFYSIAYKYISHDYMLWAFGVIKKDKTLWTRDQIISLFGPGYQHKNDKTEKTFDGVEYNFLINYHHEIIIPAGDGKVLVRDRNYTFYFFEETLVKLDSIGTG